MKTLLVLIAAAQVLAAHAAQTDSLLVVSWNVENFLDPRTDSTGRYTFNRFRSKCNGISKTLLLIAGRYGRLPDAVALMEVGDRYVLERLVRDTPLRKLDYGIVHYDSPDRRGIDCALLYRRSTLELMRSAPFHLYDSGGALMRTRDILLAEFKGLDILVNHHPSKVGADSERRRAVAMGRMTALMDSLAAAGHQRLLAVGDFNDDVWQPDAARRGESSGVTQPQRSEDGRSRMSPPRASPRLTTEGTIKYNGAWEKIDGYFARGALRVRESVFADESLSEPDKSFGGTKPRRSFSGPRWKGGISDHYPVVLWVTALHN